MKLECLQIKKNYEIFETGQGNNSYYYLEPKTLEKYFSKVFALNWLTVNAPE